MQARGGERGGGAFSGAARVTRVLLVSVGCLLLFVIVLFFVAILKEDRTGMFYGVCPLFFACQFQVKCVSCVISLIFKALHLFSLIVSFCCLNPPVS